MKKMMALTMSFVLLCVLAAVVPPQSAFAGVQATFYVSPSGSDGNPGTFAAPFATVAKARDVVRTINGNMTGDIIVNLRGGVYPLSGAIVFNEADSGTNGYNVIYQAYSGETPILEGG